MTVCPVRSAACALLFSLFAVPAAAAATAPACQLAARAPASDARILKAISEAQRQHQLFGGQTIERNGGLFRLGYHEAEWGRPAGESAPSWQRVAQFWQALSGSDPPALMTSLGRVGRSPASAAGAAAAVGSESRDELAVREALLRAAIIDTPWSAAFISHLIRTAGFTPAEFRFSDRHADYVQGALDASAAEAAGQRSDYAFRACDVATTRPRAGDLLCATRASTAGTARFDALAGAMAASAASQGFPMHCDLVVLSDKGGDAKLETIGGNVVNSVTLSRMTLNAKKVLGDAYVIGAGPHRGCGQRNKPCRDHLSRRPWLVLLQFRG